MDTALVTFIKLHAHLSFPKIKFFTFFGLTKDFLENKSFHKQYLHRVTNLTLFMQFLFVHHCTYTFPKELAECNLSLLHSAEVLGFEIFIKISIKFLHIRILKIKEWKIDKIQLTHFRAMFSF